MFGNERPILCTRRNANRGGQYFSVLLLSRPTEPRSISPLCGTSICSADLDIPSLLWEIISSISLSHEGVNTL